MDNFEEKQIVAQEKDKSKENSDDLKSAENTETQQSADEQLENVLNESSAESLKQKKVGIKKVAKSTRSSYEREDSETGFAKNLAEEALLRATRKYEVIANKLMGSFDEKGHYKIDRSILLELSKLKKVYVGREKNVVFLKSFYKTEVFEFAIVFAEPNLKQQTKSAELFLIERVEKVNGYVVNKLMTPFATYTYNNDEHFEDYCFRAFFVVKQKDDNADGSLGGDAVNIDKRLAYLLAVKEASKQKYIELEEFYFNKRMQILNSIPQATILLSEFAKKRALLERFFIGNDKNKFKALNELLTLVLEANSKMVENIPQLVVLMTPLNIKYLAETKRISAHIKVSEKYKELKEQEKEKEQEAPSGGAGGGVKINAKGKPAPAKSKPAKAKSAGKSKSGGGGSKKSAKKPAKKPEKKDNKKKKTIVVAKLASKTPLVLEEDQPFVPLKPLEEKTETPSKQPPKQTTQRQRNARKTPKNNVNKEDQGLNLVGDGRLNSLFEDEDQTINITIREQSPLNKVATQQDGKKLDNNESQKVAQMLETGDNTEKGPESGGGTSVELLLGET